MDSQKLQERYPGLNAVAYVKVAKKDDARALLDSLQQNKLPSEKMVDKIYPTTTDRLAVLMYHTSSTEFQVTGMNAFAQPSLAQTFYRSELSGVPLATEPYASRNPVRKGTQDVVIVMPIYSAGYSPILSDAQNDS